MSTTIPYRYTHLHADFYKGIDQNGPYYQVRYLFDDWSQSDDIVNYLKGYTVRVGTATVRNPPHQHPLSPNLYCMAARVVPASPPVLNAAGLPIYSGAFVVEAEYRSWGIGGPFLTSDDPDGNQQIDPTTPVLWCTQELDFDTEVYTSPVSKLKWHASGNPSDVPVKVEIGITTMILTFHQLPYIPIDLCRSYRGSVNNATFFNSPRGCLRFLGAKTTREMTATGEVTQRAQLVFKDRDYDWNKFLMRDMITWDYLWDGATYPYTYKDFSKLIQV